MSLRDMDSKSFSYSYGVKVHACLMLLAWGFCNPNGMIAVRHFKLGWPGRTFCNLTYWFLIHLMLQSALVVFVVCSFMTIVVHVAGYSQLTQLPHAAHPPLGFMIFFLTIAQLIVAWCLITSTGQRRSVFRNMHLTIGLLCQLISVPLIFIGFNMPGVSTQVCSSPVYSGVYLASILVHVIADVILEVLNYQIMFKTKALRSQFNEIGVDIDQAIRRMAQEPMKKKKITMALLPDKDQTQQSQLKAGLMKINFLRNVKYVVYGCHLALSFILIFPLVINMAYS